MGRAPPHHQNVMNGDFAVRRKKTKPPQGKPQNNSENDGKLISKLLLLPPVLPFGG